MSAPKKYRVDVTGKTFGRLTVIGWHSRANDGGSIWLCQCECGAEATIRVSHLVAGHTRSCGCLHKEQLGDRQRRHGHSSGPGSTKEYRAWKAINNRCYNKNNTDYKNYGGRGIAVCQKWRDSFEAFFLDMGPCPPEHSIDRIDNDGPYSPDNCRWADRITQNRNTRHCRAVVRDDGKRFNTISEAAEYSKAKISTIWNACNNLNRAAGHYWKYEEGRND